MDMSGRVCVVTGATDGIGKVAAAALAHSGADVVLIGRNAEKGARVLEAIGETRGNVTFERADLSVQADIRALAERLIGGLPRIDVLLNNAGGFFNKRKSTADGIEYTFALNHLSYYLLTGLVFELLNKSDGARIVNVSSRVHKGPQINLEDIQGEKKYGGWRAYQQSKLANVLFTYHLAARLAARTTGNVPTVNCLHPGFVASKFGHNNRDFMGITLRLMQQLMAINVEAGARTSIHLASSPDVAGTTARYFDKCKPVESSKESHDTSAQEALWRISEQLAGAVYD